MRKLILTCALLTSVSLLSFGQNTAQGQQHAVAADRQAPSPEKAAEMRAQRYKQQLGLNDEQYKGVYTAELEYVNNLNSFRSTGQPIPPGPAQQMQMTHDQRMQQVLTKEQYAKYEKMKTPTRQGSAASPANSNAATNH